MEKVNKINRNFKSGVFTHLFRESGKEYELYNAIAPGRFPPDTPVKDVTLNNAIYMDRVNDLSFVLGDKLVVFFEHQSTINQNMPLRDLIYCARVYEMIVTNEAMYSSANLSIPTPEFYVLYNGVADFPDKKVYRLSKMFALPPETEPSLELIVHVYNVNSGYNENIVKRSETLSGYVALMSKVRKYELSGTNRAEAVNFAVRDCINEGILAEYLEKHRSGVVNMLFQEWDWDKAKEVWQREAKEEGKAEERDYWKSVVAKVVAEKDAEIARLKAQSTST